MKQDSDYAPSRVSSKNQRDLLEVISICLRDGWTINMNRNIDHEFKVGHINNLFSKSIHQPHYVEHHVLHISSHYNTYTDLPMLFNVGVWRVYQDTCVKGKY